MAAAEAAKRLVDEMKASDAPPVARRIQGPAAMPPKFNEPGGGAEVRAAAAARVAASMALLAGAGGSQHDEGGGDGGGDQDGEVWAPPVDQQGDGRTSLNEKFGY